MARRPPVVLVHGYSDAGASFRAWRDVLVQHGYRTEDVRVCSYRTLTNEVTIKDLAEGFERALRAQAGLGDGPFDAIVHSTGMLVARAWLTQYAGRRSRLKRLVALAPATWGSPLAHRGRSWLGAIFKGSRDLTGPDFLEAGDAVLDALELGSRFTWDLAHADLLGDDVYYGPDGTTPWVFVLCGLETYTGLRAIVNEPGMDGTVRWAGCALNTRKIVLDLTVEATRRRASVAPWSNVDSDLVPIAGVDHGTILTDPEKGKPLVDFVLRALTVDTRRDFAAWQRAAVAGTAAARSRLEGELGLWQQFVVRAVDERGDPIRDYHLQLVSGEDNPFRERNAFDIDVHPYRADPSFRCFHLDLRRLRNIDHGQLRVRVIASAGSTLVAYHGHGGEKADAPDAGGKWDAQLDVGKVLADRKVKMFYPFTTTLLELRLNREPLPIDPRVAPTLFRFVAVDTPRPSRPLRRDPERPEAP